MTSKFTNHGLRPWLHSVAADAAEGALQFIHTFIRFRTLSNPANALSRISSSKCRRNLGAQSRLAFWNDGIPKPLDINAFFEERVAHVHGHRRFAKHDRNYRMFTLEDLEAEFLDMFSKIAGVGLKPLDQTSIFLENAKCLDRCDRDRRRQRVRKRIRP